MVISDNPPVSGQTRLKEIFNVVTSTPSTTFFCPPMLQFNFFDVEQQPAKIHKLNGFLPKLSQLIDIELFRILLEEARPNKEHNIERKVFDLFNELLVTQGIAGC